LFPTGSDRFEGVLWSVEGTDHFLATMSCKPARKHAAGVSCV